MRSFIPGVRLRISRSFGTANPWLACTRMIGGSPARNGLSSLARCCDRFSSWGTVWINTYGYTDIRLPWGGARDSGFGREHGDAAIENFTEPKAVWMNLSA